MVKIRLTQQIQKTYRYMDIEIPDLGIAKLIVKLLDKYSNVKAEVI